MNSSIELQNSPTCKYCSRNSVYFRRISGENFCRDHFIQSIEDRIRRTVRKYQMFSPQQKVVVGLSGGKDSLVMLYNIIKLQRRSQCNIPVEAILIDEGISGYRQESIAYAQQKCSEWNVNLHIISFKEFFGKTLDDVIPQLHQLQFNACTVCGTVRRRLLNDKALELKADRLAIGHNLDDQAETFIQNILRNDLSKIRTNPPHGNPLDPEGNFVPRVKPLITILEEEIVRYCFYLGFPIQNTPCPYVSTFPILRKKVQIFLNSLENHSAETKFNLLEINEHLVKILSTDNSMIPQLREFSFIEQEETESSFTVNKINYQEKMKKCQNCGHPCGENRKICHFCELHQKLVC
jgi:tRNA(Ile)-lysidine synthase TilS/MesJ